MEKFIFGKVMWVGKGTVFLVGLSVILAAVFAVATTAFAANGKPFLLGRNNAASAVSTLVKSGPGPALRLLVRPGNPPMVVDSQVKVANLNADMVDGKGAAEIGVNGLVRVFGDSANNSVSPKGARVECPAGKVLVGSGYGMSGGKTGTPPDSQSNLVMDEVLPTHNANGIPAGAFVEAYENEPMTGNWSVTVYAVCATGP